MAVALQPTGKGQRIVMVCVEVLQPELAAVSWGRSITQPLPQALIVGCQGAAALLRLLQWPSECHRDLFPEISNFYDR